MKFNNKRVFLASAALATFTMTLATTVVMLSNPDLNQAAALEVPVKQDSIITKYGFVLNNFVTEEDVIQRNNTLSEMLDPYGVSSEDIFKLSEASKDVFPINKMVAGKDYLLLADPKTQKAQYFIYEPTAYYYVVYDLSKMTATRVDRKVDLVEKTVSGIVQTNLWDAFTSNGLSYGLAVKMENALKYTADFFHVRKGDSFKLLYTEKFVEGKSVGIHELKAAYVKFGNDESYAFLYQDETAGIDSYFDEKARPLKKAYLKSPVEFARISSKYNLTRFHPILHYVKPHLGTDYAAPSGTPILAIADGVVEEATRRGGNGIFVKVRHDKTYESQYLHMSKYAKGMAPGVRVKQGQVIGYVGSTGLATGPHCCFRFWKNGQQVDFLKEKLPRPQPMEGQNIAKFEAARDSLMSILDVLEYPKGDDVSVSLVDSLVIP